MCVCDAFFSNSLFEVTLEIMTVCEEGLCAVHVLYSLYELWILKHHGPGVSDEGLWTEVLEVGKY